MTHLIGTAGCKELMFTARCRNTSSKVSFFLLFEPPPSRFFFSVGLKREFLFHSFFFFNQWHFSPFFLQGKLSEIPSTYSAAASMFLTYVDLSKSSMQTSYANSISRQRRKKKSDIWPHLTTDLTVITLYVCVQVAFFCVSLGTSASHNIIAFFFFFLAYLCCSVLLFLFQYESKVAL